MHSTPTAMYSSALPAARPLLCLLHITSRRTQYAAKHWHSGTACQAVLHHFPYMMFACEGLPLLDAAGAACTFTELKRCLLDDEAVSQRRILSRQKICSSHIEYCEKLDPRHSHHCNFVRKHVAAHRCKTLSSTQLALTSVCCAASTLLLLLLRRWWLVHAENNLLPTLQRPPLRPLAYTTTPQHLKLDCWGPSTRVRCNHFPLSTNLLPLT